MKSQQGVLLARETWGDTVARLASEGLSAIEIARKLKSDKRTILHYSHERGIELVDQENDDAESPTESSAQVAEIVVPTTTGIVVWLPPLPVMPQPRPDQRDRLRPILRYFEDNAANMRWRDPWDFMVWLWGQACRVSQFEADLAALRVQLAEAQGQLSKWQVQLDTRVRIEVGKQAKDKRSQLETEYASRLSSLRADLERETEGGLVAVGEATRLRARLRETECVLQRAQEVNAELYSERDHLDADNERIRDGLDLALRGWTERDGLTPDVRGVGVIVHRLWALHVEQRNENLRAWIEGRAPRRAQLEGEGR